MRSSGNRRLLQLWTQLSEQIRFVIAVTQRALPEVQWALYERPIVDAIEQKDIDKAEEAVVSCFTDAHAAINALSPDAFDALTGRGANVNAR
jgi:DNA-binding FadR family transcriptional regulator